MRVTGVQRRGDLAIGLTCGLALMAAGISACLLRGFFFAEEMYFFLTGWFALCGAMAILVLILYSAGLKINPASPLITGGNGMSGPSAGLWQGNMPMLPCADNRSSLTKIAAVLLPGCSLIILTLYGIHLLQSPLSSQGTLHELLRWALYASFALLAVYTAGTRLGTYILAAIWHSLGLTISLSALLAVCGGLPLPYAVAFSQSPEVSVTGARLAGLLQYPNTFGAVMAVFLLERLFAAAYGWGQGRTAGRSRAQRADATGGEGSGDARGSNSEAGRAGRTAAPVAAGVSALRLLPLFPYAAALLLSESRGAWLAAAAAVAAALLWKRHYLTPLLLAGAAPVAGAAILYRQLARTGLAVLPLPGLLLLAGLWAGALLAGLWLYRRGCRAAGGTRAAMLALAAAGWTAAGSAVLLHVRARMTGPSPTAAARGLLYRDAWKLAAEAPWLGRGGETWRQSYLAAQSRPYVGSQVHSGYLDILLNLGIAGLAVVLLLLAAAGWLIIKASPRLLPPLLVIILHGAVDFDWSYGLIWLLLFLLPAMALAEAEHRRAADAAAFASAHPPRSPITLYPASSHPASRRRMTTPLKRRWTCAAIILACLLTFTFDTLSFQELRGEALYRQAVREPEPAVRTALLQQALKWNPGSPQTVLTLSRLLPQEQGASLLLKALKYSPGNAALHWELAERYMAGSDPGTALYWVRRSLQQDVYNTAKRLAAAEGMLGLSQRELAAGDRHSAADSAAAGLELLRQYSLLAAGELGKGPQHNDRRFGIRPEAGGMSLRLKKVRAVALQDEAEDSSVHGAYSLWRSWR